MHNALARKPKRIRTAFSPSQLLRLEHAFEKNHYVVGAERKQLAHSLSLTETQVSGPRRGHRIPDPQTQAVRKVRGLSANRPGVTPTPWAQDVCFEGLLASLGSSTSL